MKILNDCGPQVLATKYLDRPTLALCKKHIYWTCCCAKNMFWSHCVKNTFLATLCKEYVLGALCKKYIFGRAVQMQSPAGTLKLAEAEFRVWLSNRFQLQLKIVKLTRRNCYIDMAKMLYLYGKMQNPKLNIH